MPTLPISGAPYSIDCSKGGQNPTGRKEHWVDGGNQATEVYQIAWGDLSAFRQEMLGDAAWQAVPTINIGYALKRLLPTKHPLYQWMIPQEFEVLETAGVVTDAQGGDAGDFPSTAKTLVAVTFRDVLYNVTDDATATADPNGEMSRWVVKTRQGQTQNLTLKGTFTRFKDDQAIIDTNGQRLYSWDSFLYQWNNVPTFDTTGELPGILQANIDACRGKVNSVAFDGRPAGTMLCHDPKFTRRRSNLGKLQYTIEYPIEYVLTGWNNKYRLYGSSLSPDLAPAGILATSQNGSGQVIITIQGAWTIQPVAGQYIVVQGVGDNLAVNGTWLVVSSAASQVAIKNTALTPTSTAWPYATIQIVTYNNTAGFYPVEVGQYLRTGNLVASPFYQSADLNKLFQAY